MIEQPDLETGIAVIGLAGRFPEAPHICAFWNLLREGREAITFFSDDELLQSGIPEDIIRAPNYIKAGALIQGSEFFDAEFFGYSPKEAQLLDPQQRIFLECAWHALEMSGYARTQQEASIGVFASASLNSYFITNIFPHKELLRSTDPYQILTSSDKDFLATRVSYLLNCEGPSITIQTACSSSLVAVHYACQSLLNGECEIALAGGVSLRIPQYSGYFYIPQGILSRDGHCRAFDANASGTVLGSGVGIVVLKRLEDAIADGDCIHAIIKGSAVNNDGGHKLGYTAPSIQGQARVLAEALQMAGAIPDSVSYIEAHGTATELGDAVEFAALTQIYPPRKEGVNRCALGSAKTNIGHLDAAAGIAGLIKTVLALKYRKIPPNLHFERPNKKMDLEKSAFYIPTKLMDFVGVEGPLRAGVSSFGIGGTNVHIIVQEAPSLLSSETQHTQHVLVWSAKSEHTLKKLDGAFADALCDNTEHKIADIAFTLQSGRCHFPFRSFLVSTDVTDAYEALRKKGSDRILKGKAKEHAPEMIFVFPGQEAYYRGMGSELYSTEPLFRAHVDHCVELLEFHQREEIISLFTQGSGSSESTPEKRASASVIQPLLFIIEYSLARVFCELGVKPYAMIGYDLGEFVAACVSGVFSLDDALRLVVQREPLDGKGGHSECVNSISASLHQALIGVTTQPPMIPFISSNAGTWITPQEAMSSAYWAEQKSSPVRFADGIEFLMRDNQIFLEIGPEGMLSKLMKEQGRTQPMLTLPLLGKKAADEAKVMTNTIGRLWLEGYEIRWKRIYADERRHRVTLPVYPFEKNIYWLDPPMKDKTSPPEVQEAMGSGKINDISRWFYLPVWKRTPPVDLLPSQLQNIAAECWLVFADGQGLFDFMCQEVQTRISKLIIVRAGGRFEKRSNNEFYIRRDCSQDYEELFDELIKTQLLPKRIIHLWAAETDMPPQHGIEGFNIAQEKGLYSILHIVKAALKKPDLHQMHINAVVSNIAQVTGEERELCPEQATILGFGLVLRQELPNFTWKCIDIGSIGEKRGDDRLISMLVKEFSDQGDAWFIAYRGNHRWQQAYEHIQLNVPENILSTQTEGGVYLITGGLGGVGYSLAHYLVTKRRKSNLVIIGRSILPKQEEWIRWLELHSDDDPISEKIKRVQALKEANAEVMVMSADISNKSQVAAVIDRAEIRFGKITGVIHAAGETGSDAFKPIDELNTEDFKMHFKAKATGTLVLQSLFEDRSLEFFVCISSLSSVLGGLGFGAYAAANAFSDALADLHHMHCESRWIGINWDAWKVNEERASGLAWAPDVLNTALNVDEGQEAFHRVLMHGVRGQIAISTVDLHSRIMRWVYGGTHARKDHIREKIIHGRPVLDTIFQSPRNMLEHEIVHIWQESLGIEGIGVHDNFFELGGDSLIGTHMMARINDVHRIHLPLSALFEFPTVAHLAEKIETIEWTRGSHRDEMQKGEEEEGVL